MPSPRRCKKRTATNARTRSSTCWTTNARRVCLHDSQSDYDRIARDMPEVYKFGYDATDINAASGLMERGLQAMLYDAMRSVLQDKQPDVIISTYPLYQAPLGAVFALTKKFIPLVTVVTDLVTVHQIWFSPYPDLTVVPTEAVRDLAIEAKVPAEQIEVIGIPVHPALSQETREKAAIRAELGWDPNLTTILIVGSKRSSLYVDVAHVLNHSGLPVQLIVATGGDDERYEELQKTEWHRPAHVYNFVKNMPTMMRAADAIVCKAGGLTVTESLACGLPLDVDGCDPRPGNGQRRVCGERRRGRDDRCAVAGLGNRVPLADERWRAFERTLGQRHEVRPTARGI